MGAMKRLYESRPGIPKGPKAHRKAWVRLLPLTGKRLAKALARAEREQADRKCADRRGEVL
jgi:hypothetical protein